jgi:muramoyltetrapeptide carboxypeptidase
MNKGAGLSSFSFATDGQPTMVQRFFASSLDRMNRILPPALRLGDVVGIISPASPSAGRAPRRFQRAVENLERLGFRPRIGRHALEVTDHTAGSVEARCHDLHEMFADNSVKAIIATIGGYNSNQLIDQIDYSLIERNPKIFMGYSDVSVLLASIWTKTRLGGVLGPALLPQMGEFDGLHPYTLGMLRKTLMDAKPVGIVRPSNECIVERLGWDHQDVRPRERAVNTGPHAIRHGTAEGPIVAGNMGSLLTLAGTPYWPELTGTMLFIEEDETESPETIDRYLTQMRSMGVFDQIAGLAIGRFHPDVELTPALLSAIVTRATRGYRFPIVSDLDFGHVDPMFLLPYGTKVRLEALDVPQLTFLDAAVM